MIVPRNPVSILPRVRRSLPTGIRAKLPMRIAVVLINQSRSRALNRIYRKKNRPTNVLSIRYDSSYGELLLCMPVIRREARAENHSSEFQVTRMILHGMIHLAGLHHERSDRAAHRAERVEKIILCRLYPSSGSKK